MLGEDDTLAVTADIQQHYSIDSARVFLMGVSMGGYGVYPVGLHHPDLWAGLTPMAARSDTYVWLKLKKEEIAPWKLQLYQADDPRALAPNGLDIPIYIQHGGDDDVVPVEHARLMHDSDLKKMGYPVRYREIAGGTHYIYMEADSYQIDFDWMKRLRLNTAPAHVIYNTSALRDNHAYWVTIDAFDDYAKSAHIEASIAKGTITVQSTNVRRFSLTPPGSLLGSAKVNLIVNGQSTPALDAGQPIRWGAAEPATAEAFPGTKSALHAGPIRDCYRDPILLVYGTLNEEEPELDEENAELFRDEWRRYVDGVPPMKADEAVTEDDKHNYNLVLFGTRQSNRILKDISDKLPVELVPGGYRMGAKTYPGTRLGLALAYPSPYDSKRMVVVNSGERWGTALPINHKFDLLPDFIVYNRRFDLTDGTNQALAAGFFDNAVAAPPVAPDYLPNTAEAPVDDTPKQ